MKHLFELVSKPDNIPIVGLLLLVIFYSWLAWTKARKNDLAQIPEEATARR